MVFLNFELCAQEPTNSVCLFKQRDMKVVLFIERKRKYKYFALTDLLAVAICYTIFADDFLLLLGIWLNSQKS